MVVDSSSVLQFTPQWYTPIGSDGLAAVYLASATASGFYTPGDASSTTQFTPYTSSNAAAINATDIVVTLKTLAAKYTASTMKAQINRALLTQQQALDANLVAYETVADITASGHATMIPAADLTSGTAHTYTDPAYYINASATSTLGSGASSQTALIFDLASHDITLYIYGNGNTLTINGGLIKFINGGTFVGRICLLDGVKININANYADFDVGIIGSKHVVVPSGSSNYGMSANTIRTWAIYNTPVFLYIYGMNNNTITAHQNDLIEGYIGLYGTGGTLAMDNRPVFYGRVESTVLKYLGGDPLSFPYCPSPTESAAAGAGGATSAYIDAGYLSA